MSRTPDTDRPLPPHSIEAEVALLGSLILLGVERPGLIRSAMAKLSGPQDFYLQQHTAIYQAIRSCFERGALDGTLLVEQLRADGALDSIGGPRKPADYLAEICEAVPTGIHAPHYAAIVADRAKRRRFQAWAEKAIEAAQDELNTDMPELVSRVRQDLDKALAAHGPRPSKELTEQQREAS